MIDNFNLIGDLLKWNSDDEFYFLQILRRKKDLPNEIKGSNNSARLIKSYYINNIEHFWAIKDEVVKLCEVFNARAGINLNKRSYEKCALKTASTILDQMSNKNYKSARRAFNIVCGRYTIGDKLWLLDYDEGIMKQGDFNRLNWTLNNCMPIDKNKIIATIPTKHGQHFITKPFNLKEAEYILNEFKLDVHKNNPTLLYCL